MTGEDLLERMSDGAELSPPRPGPLLIVLSGPSGVGKDTLLRRLKPLLPDIDYAVTVTTRPPRPDETPGQSYHFVDRDAFDDLMRTGRLLAAAQVHGHWYGAPLANVCDALHAGRDVLLKVDVRGAAEIGERFSHGIFIFLAPPSWPDLVDRLVGRRTETGQDLGRRIEDARVEMEQTDKYDYVVVNPENAIEVAVGDVMSIIVAERHHISRLPLDLSSC
ncbi:MAG: guanylate kinase [Chloroflexota bacterium]